jgi:signal transduction histidine kinase
VQTIRSAAARLAGKTQDERALAALQENVSTASAAAERIDGLVRRLRDFAGLDQAEVQEIDVEAALDRTIDLIDPTVRGGARVERAYAGGVRLVCRAKEINQVFFTLISNAFQAMEGEGELRVETQRRDGAAVIRIADTGKGLAPEELAQLFEMRFAAKGRRVGMSLGLPMARSIVESHGGKIEAKSEIGRGTRFEITLRDRE